MTAEESLKHGDLQQSLNTLQAKIRSNPADVTLRIFLFQLLCVLGEWKRALTQLKVIAKLDDGALAMVHTYRTVIQCELFREQVFAGKKAPLFFGKPETWQALMIQALKLTTKNKHKASRKVRDEAFATAPAISGKIDDVAFEWISDADMRMGPMLEVIIDGRYFWVPFSAIELIDIEEPEDLRDSVWMPAHIRWITEGEMFVLIPTRYPNSVQKGNAFALSRQTEWQSCGKNMYLGYGQRLFTTNEGDYPIMDTRRIQFDKA